MNFFVYKFSCKHKLSFSRWFNLPLVTNCLLPHPPSLIQMCLTFDQSVFVRWRWSSEDSELGPNLIKTFLLNLQNKKREKTKKKNVLTAKCWFKSLFVRLIVLTFQPDAAYASSQFSRGWADHWGYTFYIL